MGAFLVAQSAENLPATQETSFNAGDHLQRRRPASMQETSFNAGDLQRRRPASTQETSFNAGDQLQCRRPASMQETTCNAGDQLQRRRPPSTQETSFNAGDLLQRRRPPSTQETSFNAGDQLQRRRPGFDPGSGRSPGEGNGTPLQYSCLKNPMDGGAWRAAVHGVIKRLTQLCDCAHTARFTYLKP